MKKKEDISAVIMAYNDEERLPKLFESLKGIKDIVISLDEKSTDRTGEIAKSMGAKVVKRSDFWENPTYNDIQHFKDRFGFEPKFTTKDKYCQWSVVRNEATSYAKNDWVFFPDSDEFVEWDLPEIKKLLFFWDQISYKFIFSSNPPSEFTHCKLYRKSRNKWAGSVHEVVVPIMNNIRTVYTDKMKLIHHKAERPYRNDFLPRMEFAYIRNWDLRTLFYLAREYYYYKEYQKALQLFNDYMSQAWWRPEIAEAWLLMAKCCWQIQKGDDSRRYCLNAIAVNPDFKEALMDMSEYTGDNQKEYWKRYADIATSHNVLFKRV